MLWGERDESSSRAGGVQQAVVVSQRECIEFPPFRLDLVEERLWCGDRIVPLKPKAFAILRYLLERPGRLISKRELRAQFWADVHTSDGVVKTHMGEIRRSLGDSAQTPRFILTDARRGYRFIAHVVPAGLDSAPASNVSRRIRETDAPCSNDPEKIASCSHG